MYDCVQKIYHILIDTVFYCIIFLLNADSRFFLLAIEGCSCKENEIVKLMYNMSNLFSIILLKRVFQQQSTLAKDKMTCWTASKGDKKQDLS